MEESRPIEQPRTFLSRRRRGADERVLRVSLDEPLRDLEVSGTRATAVVIFAGAVIGELPLEGERLTASEFRDLLGRELRPALWRAALRSAFGDACGRPADPGPPVDVSAVVLGPSPRCRDALESLNTPPCEIVSDASEATAEFVAFFRSDWSVEPGWLDGLGSRFRDSLTAAVGGYVGPSGSNGPIEPHVTDGRTTTRSPFPLEGAVVRRRALSEHGTLDGMLEAGLRLAFEPARIAWRSGRPVAANPQAPPAPLDVPPAARVTGSEHPRLSVAIASYNRREKLAAALEALGNQSYPADRYETVVVLDGSTDGSGEMVRSLELPCETRVVEQENRGLAAARNRGAQEAASPVVVFLDDDILAEPAFLSEHAAAHQAAREPHYALGHYPPLLRGVDLWSLSVRTWWEDYFRRKTEPGHRWTFIDLSDGNSSVPRDAFLSWGGFNEVFRGGRRQDWELGARLLKAGVPLRDYPSALGWHDFETSFPTALRNARQEGRWDIELMRCHPELGHRLPIAAYAARMGIRRKLAYRWPVISERAAAAALPALRTLERLGRRAEWRRLSVLLLSHAYILGMTDALPSLSEFDSFVEPLRRGEGLTQVPVWLDGEPTALPDKDPISLILGVGGTQVADVQPLAPGDQWDWDAVIERVTTESWASFAQVRLSLPTTPEGSAAHEVTTAS